MNRLFKTVAISTAIVTSTLAVPAQAAVIDQIKTKVEAIKNDTATIKSRTNDLQERAEEIAATASAQIIETADIKGALEPLFGLKERFSEMEFDPAELLEAFDIQDLKDVLAELKQQREEVELAMFDPGLEAFRTELLDMLEGINSLFAEDGLVQGTPLQKLVENAPLKVVAVLKMVFEDTFTDLVDTVSQQVASMNNARQQGMLPANLFSGSAQHEISPGNVAEFLWDNNTGICSLWGQYLDVPILVLSQLQYNNTKILNRLKEAGVLFKDRLDRDHSAQIHGYLGIEINIGERGDHAIAYYTIELEDQNAGLGIIKDYLGFLHLSGACGATGN